MKFLYIRWILYHASIIFEILFVSDQSSQLNSFVVFDAIIYILQWFIPDHHFTLLRETNSDIYY